MVETREIGGRTGSIFGAQPGAAGLVQIPRLPIANLQCLSRFHRTGSVLDQVFEARLEVDWDAVLKKGKSRP